MYMAREYLMKPTVALNGAARTMKPPYSLHEEFE
jgi:hypothetical protein